MKIEKLRKTKSFSQMAKKRTLTQTVLLRVRFCADNMFKYSYTSSRRKPLDTRSNCANLKRNV